jgi:hypothetical protein
LKPPDRGHYDLHYKEKYDAFQSQVRIKKTTSMQRALSDQQNILRLWFMRL